MYLLKKRIEIAGAHHLLLDYISKCSNVHGHNWIITVYCASETLNKNGMVVDFAQIKKVVMELDHAMLNDVLGDMNPTAENIARYLCDKIPHCYKVDVEETEGNMASYEKVGGYDE